MTVMPSPSSVSYIQLRRICSAYGLPSTGPRATLERRIMLHEREAVDTDEEDKEEGEEQNEQEGEGAGVDDEEEGSNEMPVLTEDEDEGHDGKGKGKGSNTAKDALRLWGGEAATPSAKATVAVHGSSGGGWFNDPHREATEYVRHDGLASKLHRAHPLSLSFAPHPPTPPLLFPSLPPSFLPSLGLRHKTHARCCTAVSLTLLRVPLRVLLADRRFVLPFYSVAWMSVMVFVVIFKHFEWFTAQDYVCAD